MANQKSMSRRRFLRLFGTFAGGIAGASLLSTCQPKTVIVKETIKETVMVEGTPKVVEKVVTAEPVGPKVFTLRHMIRSGDIGQLYPAKLAEFNTDHPNIKASIEPIPGGDVEYVPKLMAMHAAGTLGDTCWTSIGSVNHYQYADMGITIPLDDLVASANYDKSPFYPESWESSKYSGKLYGLPLLAHPGTAMLVYNRGLFEEEGMEEPNEDWTLDDLLQAAKHFTRDTNGDGRIDSWGFNPSTGRLVVMLIRCFSGYDGDMINPEGTKAMVNHPETKDALRWVQALYQEHQVTPTPESLEMGFNQLFMAGRVAMYQTGCWGGTGFANVQRAARDFTTDWWVTSLPKGPSGVLGSHAEVDCVCVTSQSEHKAEAFELLTYFVSKDAGVLLGLNFGCAGARGDQYEDPKLQGTHFSKDDKALFEIYNKINDQAGPYFYPANLHGQEAFQVYGQALAPLWLGKEEPIDAFFDDVNQQLQTVLDKPKAGAG